MALPAPLADPLTRDGARAAARRELSRAEYHRDDPTLLGRLARAVSEFLAHLLGRISGAPGGLFGVLLLTGLLLLAAFAVRARLGRLPMHDPLHDPGPASRETTAAEYRREAERLAEAGQLAEALRATTRALVRELETRGVLQPRPARTAAGVAREVAAAAPPLGPDVRAVTGAFESVWYGGRAATAADWAAARDAEERVRRARTPAPLQPSPA